MLSQNRNYVAIMGLKWAGLEPFAWHHRKSQQLLYLQDNKLILL